MADNLADMIGIVRDWSNRDSDQLSDGVITQCLRFAADTAYRQLMIPPLEHTSQVLVGPTDTDTARPANLPSFIPFVRVATGGGQVNAVERQVNIPVPGDLTSFIHLRILGTAVRDANDMIQINDDNTIMTENTGNRRFGIVFNEKTDVRTFHDLAAEKTATNYWTRQGNNILANGFLGTDDVLEIYYYRRLARLGATFTTGDNTGDEVPNWLINENEKVVLFGALWQAFDYLQDQALSQSYFVKFGQAIEELNEEEKTRRASGGNVQVNFNGRGLI